MREWQPVLEQIQKDNIRFIEILHVDGRRFYGEYLGLREGLASRPELLLKDLEGKEVRLYFPTIRDIHY